MSAAPDLIVVSVGTDHHPFDRLVSWMDDWAARHPACRVVIQRGEAAEAEHCESHPLISYRQLCRLFAEASLVVSHGGPSTVMDARSAGRLPIVVPRDPARGEHVDDHQLRFSHHLERHGLATVATRRNELDAAVRAGLDSPERFTVATSQGELPGVVAFSRVIDELIGDRVPIQPGTIADHRLRRWRW